MKPIWQCAVDQTIQFSEHERIELEANFSVDYFNIQSAPKEQLAKYDMFLIHSKIPSELLSSFKRCQYIGVRAHNTDYISSELALKYGIEIQGIPQVGEISVAEHTFSLIFAVTKHLLHSNSSIKEGKWREGLKPNFELRGKKLGIIGHGKIGKEVAKIGAAFGMNPLIASSSSNSKEEHLSIEEVLKQSDIVTLHASTKANSEPLITSEQISMMKDGAILINTARGSLLNYKDLEEALRIGKLYGAGLDVYPDEPILHSQLCELNNVVCTPHVAYYTNETIARMNQHVILQAIEYFLHSTKMNLKALN